MKMSKTLLPLAMVSLLLSSYVKAADNEITIEQSGDNFDLNISQKGYSNVIKRWRSWDEGITGANNTFDIRQHKTHGSSSDQNVLELRQINGTGNTLKLAQGWQIGTNGNFGIDNSEYGDTFAHINITGDYNDVMMTQRTNSSSSGHQYWLHVEGDNNDIYTVQREGGSQYINLDIYNDGNDVDLRQTNAGDHYMSVILRGTQPTDISVIQNGWNNKSYSITNYCYTAGGCSISVTQGN